MSLTKRQSPDGAGTSEEELREEEEANEDHE